MSSDRKIDLGLTGYDELFMDDQGRAEAKLPRIYEIPLSEIDDFPDHPFTSRPKKNSARGVSDTG